MSERVVDMLIPFIEYSSTGTIVSTRLVPDWLPPVFVERVMTEPSMRVGDRFGREHVGEERVWVLTYWRWPPEQHTPTRIYYTRNSP